MSPRRSVRARQHPPLIGTLKHSNSNASSSSGRLHRNSRINYRKGSFNRSPSSEIFPEGDLDAMDADQQARQTRQKRRGQDVTNELDVTDAQEEALEDADEEEITRCVCRRQEYPGPPVPLEEGSRSHKAKDYQSGVLTLGDSLPEDAGSLFIQCDDCKVWQHGGCVGIMDESMSPENYYCEECRKDLHRLMTGARGQRYSRYLPVYEAAHPPPKIVAKSPPSKDSDSRSSRDPESKSAQASMRSAKRRSTMNSRAAMDEEEAFRKAIEESRTDGSVAGTTNGSRKGKRGREDSDDGKHDLKRRKTGSEEDSPKDMDLPQPGIESDDEGQGGTKSRTSNAARKARGAAAQVEREKQIREREKERERERIEAAGRRSGRANKRHVDESEEPLEEPPIRASATPRTAPVARATKATVANKTPAAASPLAHAATSHKKQTRPATARRARLGRNQYNRDRDLLADGKTATPRPSHSRDGEDVCSVDMAGLTGQLLSNGSKASKPRHMNPNRTTMNDMRKRTAGILEYISRTQVEMAGEKSASTSSSASVVAASTPFAPPPAPPIATQTPARPPLGRTVSVNGLSKLSRQLQGDTGGEVVALEKEKAKVDESEFRQMSTTQMMDVLTRELVHWQKAFGKWGER